MSDQRYEEEGQEINFLDMLQLLVRRRILIAGVCFAAACGSAGYSLTMPNIYSATAKVLPPQKEGPGGLSALLGQAGGLAGLAGGLTGGTDLFIGILKSRTVTDGVIQKLDLMKVYQTRTLQATRPIVEAALKVQSGTDGIIVISAEDTDPNRAALLANAFASELGRATVRLNLTKVGNERLFLEKRLDVVRGELAAAEEDMKRFSLKNKIVQLDSQSKASFEGIAKLKSEIASKEVQLSVLRASMTDGSPDVKALRVGIQKLRAELGEMENRGGAPEGIPALGNMPSLGVEYTRKMRELKTREAVFEQLSKQYEVAKLNEAKDASAFQVVDEAIPSTVKVGPKRVRIVIVSTVVAFFASLVVVLIQDRLGKLGEEHREALRSLKKQLFSLN